MEKNIPQFEYKDEFWEEALPLIIAKEKKESRKKRIVFFFISTTLITGICYTSFWQNTSPVISQNTVPAKHLEQIFHSLKTKYKMVKTKLKTNYAQKEKHLVFIENTRSSINKTENENEELKDTTTTKTKDELQENISAENKNIVIYNDSVFAAAYIENNISKKSNSLHYQVSAGLLLYNEFKQDIMSFKNYTSSFSVIKNINPKIAISTGIEYAQYTHLFDIVKSEKKQNELSDVIQNDKSNTYSKIATPNTDSGFYAIKGDNFANNTIINIEQSTSLKNVETGTLGLPIELIYSQKRLSLSLKTKIEYMLWNKMEYTYTERADYLPNTVYTYSTINDFTNISRWAHTFSLGLDYRFYEKTSFGIHVSKMYNSNFNSNVLVYCSMKYLIH